MYATGANTFFGRAAALVAGIEQQGADTTLVCDQVSHARLVSAPLYAGNIQRVLFRILCGLLALAIIGRSLFKLLFMMEEEQPTDAVCLIIFVSLLVSDTGSDFNGQVRSNRVR